MTVQLEDLQIRTLGECRHTSPFSAWLADKQTTPHFVHEDDRVMLDDTTSIISANTAEALPSFECAGPRRKIYFDPARTTVGIVSCGGLCPGINNVISGVVQELTVHYRVRRILGFRNGLKGLTAKYRNDTMDLTQINFQDITRSGGTILGSSRGDQDADEMVDTLVARKIDILFVIGGDGSIRAATRLVSAITRRDSTSRWSRSPRRSTTTCPTPTSRSASRARSNGRPTSSKRSPPRPRPTRTAWGS